MKAIETVYKGYRFRSRLEARWAVYFNTLNIEFYYEHEGFDLGEVGWYLPDFYLPHAGIWAEVKPVDFTPTEIQKVEFLAKCTQQRVLMLMGPPDQKTFTVCHYDNYSRPPGIDYYDVVISNYHNYYQNERRFYAMPYEGEVFHPNFDDVSKGILAARSARFNEYRHPTTLTA